MPRPPAVSESDARALLREQYGMEGVLCVSLLRGGSANCREVRAAEGHFVLKEFQPRFSVEDIEVEPAVTEFVASRGIPTAEFVRTLTGEYVWEHSGRAFHLQRFVEGHIYPQNAAPDWLLWESAAVFGRLHAVLADFPAMKRGFPESWFKWNAEVKRRQYADLIGLAEALPAGGTRDRILNGLHHKAGLTRPECHRQIEPDRLTYTNSHGDYHILQIICGERSITAVIDFSGACEQPAMWEVIRSYSLGDPACTAGKLDVERLKEYVRAYLGGGGALSRYDLRMMPYLYHWHLARSRYGYEEYLSRGKSGFFDGRSAERLEDLLQFGFWRTEMCRWLAANGGEVSGQLEELAP